METKLKAAASLSILERDNLRTELISSMQELEEWLRELEDAELVRNARKMDVHLDDIPVPPKEVEDAWVTPDDQHYRYSSTFSELLLPECRSVLIKATRERTPAYRRERREVWELWIKAATVLIGLIGAATGLVAVWKR